MDCSACKREVADIYVCDNLACIQDPEAKHSQQHFQTIEEEYNGAHHSRATCHAIVQTMRYMTRAGRGVTYKSLDVRVIIRDIVMCEVIKNLAACAAVQAIIGIR